MTTILISYCDGSYQFRDSAMDHFFDRQDFDKIKELVTDTLTSANLYRKGDYWAMFRTWVDGKWVETPELFEERIKMSKNGIYC